MKNVSSNMPLNACVWREIENIASNHCSHHQHVNYFRKWNTLCKCKLDRKWCAHCYCLELFSLEFINICMLLHLCGLFSLKHVEKIKKKSLTANAFRCYLKKAIERRLEIYQKSLALYDFFSISVFAISLQANRISYCLQDECRQTLRMTRDNFVK